MPSLRSLTRSTEIVVSPALSTLGHSEHERCLHYSSRARQVGWPFLVLSPLTFAFLVVVSATHHRSLLPPAFTLCVLSFLGLLLLAFYPERVALETRFLALRLPSGHTYHSTHFFRHVARALRAGRGLSLTPLDIPREVLPFLDSYLAATLSVRERDTFDVLVLDSPSRPLSDLLFAAQALS